MDNYAPDSLKIKVKPVPKQHEQRDERYPMLDHVIAQEEAVKTAKDAILGFQNNHVLRYHGVAQVKGILLYGGPGIGKTFLAKAISNEADAIFTKMSMSDVGTAFINETANAVRAKHDNLINALNGKTQKRYGIIFMDECEQLCGKRGGWNRDEDDKALITLCEVMDGVYADPRVLFIGATNRRGDMDEAVIRAGRFEIEVPMKKPDAEGRYALFKNYERIIRKKDGKPNFKPLNFEKLGEISTGLTGADIAYIMQESVRQEVYNILKTGSIEGVYVPQQRIEDMIKKQQATKITEKQRIGFRY